MARSIIRENHPLNPTPVYVAYPILRPFASCLAGRNKDYDEPLLNENEQENSNLIDKKSSKKKTKSKVDEEELNQDPFLLLGFGMIAYRDLLLTFAFLFSLLSLIMLPAMIYYRGHDGIIKPQQF